VGGWQKIDGKEDSKRKTKGKKTKQNGKEKLRTLGPGRFCTF